ncbi:MAG: DNA-processing protein DprA [Actinomycetaceae bacterium]|nr:DNA-processing protein DprA [Actinomycetaceae bacterium]
MPTPKELLTHAWWSAIAEPADLQIHALRLALGDDDAQQWILTDPPGPLPTILTSRQPHATWERAWNRWHPRAIAANPESDLADLDLLGGHLLIPTSPNWPTGLDDLGPAAPTTLWVRGTPPVETSLAIVGARAATPQGTRTARDLAAGAAAHHIPVISGGAFGIDIAAHTGALDGGGTTTVILAGGLANPYPAAHSHIYEQILNSGGALISEVPPSWRPAKWRFLERNRLIAALAGATIVVEASHRSGALATARRAMDLGRDVGAVPGPLSSSASMGCHDLIRNGATLIRHSDDALELLGAIGETGDPTLFGAPVEKDHGINALPAEQRRVWEALPARSVTTLDRLIRASGLGRSEVLGALGYLELRGLIRSDATGWARR